MKHAVAGLSVLVFLAATQALAQRSSPLNDDAMRSVRDRLISGHVNDVIAIVRGRLFLGQLELLPPYSRGALTIRSVDGPEVTCEATIITNDGGYSRIPCSDGTSFRLSSRGWAESGSSKGPASEGRPSLVWGMSVAEARRELTLPPGTKLVAGPGGRPQLVAVAAPPGS